MVHLPSTSSRCARCALRGVVQQLSSSSSRCAMRALKGVVQQLYTRKFSEASIVSNRWFRLQKCSYVLIFVQFVSAGKLLFSEAEFLDVIGTKM